MLADLDLAYHVCGPVASRTSRLRTDRSPRPESAVSSSLPSAATSDLRERADPARGWANPEGPGAAAPACHCRIGDLQPDRARRGPAADDDTDAQRTDGKNVAELGCRTFGCTWGRSRRMDRTRRPGTVSAMLWTSWRLGGALGIKLGLENGFSGYVATERGSCCPSWPIRLPERGDSATTPAMRILSKTLLPSCGR